MAAANPPGGSQPAYPIGSVENALRLLRLLRDRPSIRVSDAARELSVAPSTAHRLLAMLQSYEFVVQDPEKRAYRPGPALVELGLATLRQDDVRNIMRPFIEELSAAAGETVHLIVREGSNCRCVDGVESGHALRTMAQVGMVYPAHLIAGGKALLAELDDKELRNLYPSTRLQVATQGSLASRAQLLRELEVIREAGYATSFSENELGISSVAVVQRTSSGRAAAAIGVSAPEQRLPQARVPEIIELMAEVTSRAARRLP